MGLDQVANYLGQTGFPQIAAVIFLDTMTIQASVTTKGSGGGQVKSGTTDVYTDVPVNYIPIMRQERRDTENEQLTSFEDYVLAFPTHQDIGGDNVRIDLDPTKHRFIVQPRGNEPEKTFRFISLREDSGVVFEAVCQKEN